MNTDERIAAAEAGIRRLSGLPSDRISVNISPSEHDSFSVTAADGIFAITASDVGSALTGYAQYARATRQGSVSRSGIRPLAAVDDLILQRTAWCEWRIAYNITVGGYTTPFFNWDDWERELDLLAASGVNAAHLTLGQEAVWLETFTRFGYTEQEILAWIVPPSHQPWQWLNNIQNYGGGVTRQLVDRRVELARRVIQRMRELNIVPILPGFSGTVPSGFDAKNPGAEIVPQGLWFMDVAGPERPDWLRTDSPLYGEVADVYYSQQQLLFGEGGTWAVDLLHEGGKTGGANLTDATHGVEVAMRRAHPDYTWVAQAWAANPRQEFLDAADHEHLLILDLTGETWERMKAFSGAPWVLGILPNYGGRLGLYGDLKEIADIPKLRGLSAVNRLRGITDMAEGVANNPIVWDLFHDVAWANEAIDLEAWTADWVAARYGSDSPEALEAWQQAEAVAYGRWRTESKGALPEETRLTLAGETVDAGTPASDQGETVWNITDDAEITEVFEMYAGTDSVIASVPSIHANQASMVGPRVLGYEPGALDSALELLLSADLPSSLSRDHDLVDLTREVLDDAARRLLPGIADAHHSQDLELFDRGAATFLRVIDAEESILATNEYFLLGSWTERARAWGSTPEEREALAREAKRLLTSWGMRDSTVLTEYANRTWAGLVGTYYRARWEKWFAELRYSLTGAATTPIDWFEVAEEWVSDGAVYSTGSVGETRQAALAALELVREIGSSPAV
jgi:Alpha-N-acetylglucosaminidase (NAGLU) tim-barrel domain/Alpha-N-acetylglucosaminidase (NAGLU) C-terminal domain